MKPRNSIPITVDRVREAISFDPLSGEMKWKICLNSRAPAGRSCGFIHKTGYLKVKIDGLIYMGHRLAWFHFYGEWPDNYVDHINGNRSDNRIDNLRDVSMTINNQNERKSRGNNRIGLLGVSPHYGKFMARIRINNINKYLGVFDTAELAHNAYIEAKRQNHLGCTI